MAADQGFGRTARTHQVAAAAAGSTENVLLLLLDALILHQPLAHLAKIQELIVLVQGPAHVENNGFDFARKQCLHVLARLLVPLKAARELFHVAAQYLDLEAVQAAMLVQDGNHGLLVTIGGNNHVASH